MDNGEGAILSLIVIVIVAAIIIGIVIALAGVWLAIMGVVAAYAILSGFLVGLANFFQTLKIAHQEAAKRPVGISSPVLISRLYEPQPADLSYFVDAGWFVIHYMAKEVWAPTQGQANDWFERGSEWLRDSKYKGSIQQYFMSAMGIGAYIGGALHYLSALVFVAVFVFLEAIVLTIGSLISAILMAFIGVGTWLFGRLNKIYYRCPSCHETMRIPVHVCPTCSTEHTRLWPSVYGVFHHRCRGTLPSGGVCGTRLPTIGILGRRRLVELCPICNRELEGIGTGTNVHIPIVGGPGVGKSHYIVMATKDLLEEYAPSHKLTVDLPDTQHRSNFEASVQLLNSGKRLVKTSNSEDSASAYNLQLKQSRFRIPKLMYIYDAAGEYYKSEEHAIKQTYFKYTHGILLIIDPFAISQVYIEYEEHLKTSKNQVSPSRLQLDDVFSTMLTVLEHSLSLKPGRKAHCPVAVVITKADAFDLEEVIGKPAADKLMKEHPEIHHEDDAINLLVERFLRDKGESNFVNSLHTTFKTVRFFSCSAVGEAGVGEAQSFEGVRVLKPLLWLLGQIKVLPVNRERAREVDAYDRLLGQSGFRSSKFAYWRYYLWDSLKPINKTDVA